MNEQTTLKGISHNYAFNNWENMSERDQLLSMISDDYKSLNGTRPRFSTEHLTLEELKNWHNEIKFSLAMEYKQELDEETAHQLAVARYTKRSTGFTINQLTSLDLLKA